MAARQFGAKREARRAVRRVVDLECQVYCDLWGEPIPHRATDVSEEGLWIPTELLLEIGTEVTLTFHPPDWEAPLCVAGRVQRLQLRSRAGDANSVGMGIEFESLRNDERRHLTHSMRCLRAQEAFILDQRTLTGVPVSVAESFEPCPEPARTIAGWAAAPSVRDRTPGSGSMIPRAEEPEPAGPKSAFGGGIDLATSVFSFESD